MTPRQLSDLFERIGLSRAAAARELGIDERTLRRKLNGEQMIERVIELAARYLEMRRRSSIEEVRLPRPSTPPIVPAPPPPARPIAPPTTKGESAGAAPMRSAVNRPGRFNAGDLQTLQQSVAQGLPAGGAHPSPPGPTNSVLARMAQIKTRS